MSQLISSAVSGKTFAPKAPVRRRQAPPKATPASSPAPASSSEPTSVAPPSPPPTQVEPQAIPHPEPISEPQPPRQPTPPPPPPPSDDGPEHLAQFVRAQIPEATQQESTTIALSTEQLETPTEQAKPTAAVTRDEGIGAAEAANAPTRSSRKRKNDGAQAQQPKPPAKRQKRISARSNVTVQARVNEDEPAVEPTLAQGDTVQPEQPAEVSTEGASTRTRRPRAAKATAKAASKPAPKRQPKRKSAAMVPEEDRKAQDEQVQDGEPTEAAAPKRKPKHRKKKAAQTEGQDGQDDEVQGSDPELHEIDPNTLSMYELTRMRKGGKVSDREKKMREINWDEVRQKRNEAVERIVAGQQDKDKDKDADQPAASSDPNIVESTEGPSGTAEGAEDGDDTEGQGPRSSQPSPAQPEPEAETEAPAQGLQLRIVNGQIVEDEASLAINLPGPNGDPNSTTDIIEEENDLTQRLNRTTYLNDRRREASERVPVWRQKSDPWTESETERFYEQLAIWGTDFAILAAMFPPRTRRQIKKKFNREEKVDPSRVTATLLGKPLKTMNLTDYAEETGRDLAEYMKFDSAEHADGVIRESMREREEAMRKALGEQEEIARQEVIAAGQREAGRREVERRRKGRGVGKGKRKRGMGAGTLGGSVD